MICNINMEFPMLNHLLDLNLYFPFPENALYEEDLISQFGLEKVSSAIKEGYLEHAWIPCATGRRRCVIKLSEKGIKQASVFAETRH